MTTKRTHGPCTCAKAAIPSLEGHQSDCPSLYPAQQEPDALTRLVRMVRQHGLDWVPPSDAWTEQALSLISEAREEQMKAVDTARNDGIERVARAFEDNDMSSTAADVRRLKDAKP